MKVDFHTDEYMFSHAKAPSGRGSWAFQICAINGETGKGGIHFSPSMTLADARRWAKPMLQEEAKAIIGNDSKIVVIDADILP